ncbi:MAG: 50S ribosomal protein L19 [Planctomycetes bacterium RBG_16_43_13]|nr:MAG: 50S ribosomal protein L19 [Planctomycetes bacterium RBG_16_43_13]
MRTMDFIEKNFLKKHVPLLNVGDTVDVHVKIKEGEKERIQIFSGTVIKKKGGGTSETFTVRRIVQGEGVERIFPLHSPNVAKVVVKKQGNVRRAKLYYLRERVGRATKVEEKVGAAAYVELIADEDTTTKEDKQPEKSEQPKDTKPTEKQADKGGSPQGAKQADNKPATPPTTDKKKETAAK